MNESESDMTTQHVQQMFQMITGYWVSQIVGTVARLGIADRLAAKPATAATLASELGIDQDAAARLLRAAASVGLIATAPDGTATTTPLGELLRANTSGSLRDLADALTAPGHWLPWGRLSDAIRTGEPQARVVFGMDLVEYWSKNQDEGIAVTGAMANYSASVADETARLVDTSMTKLAVDVGGASGTIITALLRRNPALSGMIVDLPHVIDQARAALVKQGMSSRCGAVAGDFFESVPEADLYLIKSVIHDWNDEQSIRILSNCSRNLRADGRVLVIETLLPEDDRPSSAPLIDINMMVLTPGRERTTSEYAALLKTAGLRIDRVIETQTPMQIIEARK
jgi:hypothetical protein